MRRIPRQNLKMAVRRVRDQRVVIRQTFMLWCGLVLAGGFIFAAGQHFIAIQYGYQSEELRHEKARLLEERQRLLLALDETASPAYLERAAREIGLQPTRPSQVSRGKSSDASLAHPAPGLVGVPAGAVLPR